MTLKDDLFTLEPQVGRLLFVLCFLSLTGLLHMTVFGEDSSDKEEVDRIAKETGNKELDGKSLKIYFDFPAEYQRLERMVK